MNESALIPLNRATELAGMNMRTMIKPGRKRTQHALHYEHAGDRVWLSEMRQKYNLATSHTGREGGGARPTTSAWADEKNSATEATPGTLNMGHPSAAFFDVRR